MPSGTNWGTLALQQVPDFPPSQYAVVSLQLAAPASTVLAQTVALTSTAATTSYIKLLIRKTRNYIY